MTKFQIERLLVIWLTLSITGCSPVYYAPNSHSVPLFQKKCQKQLGVVGEKERIEFQSAFAVGEQMAIMMNGGLYFPEENDNGNGGEGQFIETGAGYFSPFKKSFIFETYGLLGYGHFENHFPFTATDSTTGIIDGKLLKYSLQTNLGYTHRVIDLAGSLRLSGLRYFHVHGDMIFEEVDQKSYLRNRKDHFLIEPAITLRAGYDVIKAQIQYGTSWNIFHKNFRQDESYITIGLIYRFCYP